MVGLFGKFWQIVVQNSEEKSKDPSELAQSADTNHAVARQSRAAYSILNFLHVSDASDLLDLSRGLVAGM